MSSQGVLGGTIALIAFVLTLAKIVIDWAYKRKHYQQIQTELSRGLATQDEDDGV